jgi:hypothetical protein
LCEFPTTNFSRFVGFVSFRAHPWSALEFKRDLLTKQKKKRSKTGGVQKSVFPYGKFPDFKFPDSKNLRSGNTTPTPRRSTTEQ